MGSSEMDFLGIHFGGTHSAHIVHINIENMYHYQIIDIW